LSKRYSFSAPEAGFFKYDKAKDETERTQNISSEVKLTLYVSTTFQILVRADLVTLRIIWFERTVDGHFRRIDQERIHQVFLFQN
jgi:hypothetical protein